MMSSEQVVVVARGLIDRKHEKLQVPEITVSELHSRCRQLGHNQELLELTAILKKHFFIRKAVGAKGRTKITYYRPDDQIPP